ncbi:DinB family protein [Winogradskyella alexanderae]|uniref:DUF1572 domain-containing protein n=1 Tax=Winogradskyella alexanderae TaxID=2877123 RepID=A0ABS7XQG6_9FLAO|nr:DinB family protein [Winogradskyella alexanderae]MCA0131649.1 DUF1572 domain-containing protein [Winogradskyella alexanderae]
MTSYLNSVLKQFEYYKSLGDNTIERLSFDELNKEFAQDGNSISIIVKHMAGNMLSRWTNFMTEDGEKKWRERDEEFIGTYLSKEELIDAWNKGWGCLFNTLKSLTNKDLERIIYIRNQGHTVTEAINRQMMHYAYHVGQIVFIGKLILGKEWKSLSVPKGQSKVYNKEKFAKGKSRRHFTEDL